MSDSRIQGGSNKKRSNSDKSVKGFGKKRTGADRGQISVKKRSIFLTPAVLILLAVIVGCVLFSIFSSFFDLKTISVSGLSGHTEEEIIETSCIELGKKLYSIGTEGAKTNILAKYPNIARVDIKKQFPSGIIIQLTYEVPTYFVEITGEYFSLSESMRVIERSKNKKTFEEMGLVYLELPNIKRAVAGEHLMFFKGDEEYIGTLLEKISASVFDGDIDRIYIKSKFDIALVKVGEYRLEMGDFKNVELKLLMADKIMEEGGYRGQSGVIIDVSDVSESSAMIEKNQKIE